MDSLWPEYDMEKRAINLLQRFSSTTPYYVAFGGGKDSIVTLHLVKKAGVPYEAVYNVTGLDPPELVRFIKQYYPDVRRRLPDITMWKLAEKNGFLPTRYIRYCCKFLKERTSPKDKILVTGIRAEESVARRSRKQVEVNRITKNLHIKPIFGWASDELWDYIRTEKIPYCELYDQGWNRLGCIGCPMASKYIRRRDFARWPQYERLWRKACEDVVRVRKKRGLSCYGGIDTGEGYFTWWMGK